MPTTELAQQVVKLTQSLVAHCGQDVKVANLANKASDVVQRALLADIPDIVVATPSRALANFNSGAFSLKDIRSLVIDEGDLILGYGFETDMESIAKGLPKGVQILYGRSVLIYQRPTNVSQSHECHTQHRTRIAQDATMPRPCYNRPQ